MAIYFGGDSGGGDSTEGRILQVQLTTKTNTFSNNSDSFTDISGMNVAITPHNSGNKILIIATLDWSTSQDGYSSLRLLRGSTAIGVAAGSGSRTPCGFALQSNYNANNKLYTATYTYLDEPSTTGSITYKLQCRTYSGDARYFTINRTGSDSNVNYHHRGISRIMAMEVAA
tara:strand:- start:243 stop:758 length:516 start_codon:yes stop_codon:yes gene_type:complete